MEKFFIVNNDSNLGKDYWEYIENSKMVNTYVQKFMDDNNIKTNMYYPSAKYFYIVPTDNDINNFSNQLSIKERTDDLRQFKKNSEIGKAWSKLISENNLRIIQKPYIGFYIKLFGKFNWRLFHIDNIIYGSLESTDCSFDLPEGLTEIKGSEFYKVIEKEGE